MPYDGIKDFTPVAFVADAETVLVVNPAIPATSVAALIALAKAKPGELTSPPAEPAPPAISRVSCSRARPAPRWSTFRTRATRRR